MRNWKAWARAAGIRAARTFGEAALSYIGTSALVLGDVNWVGVLSAGALGAISSFFLALKGLPEVTPEDELEEESGEYLEEDQEEE